jgi:hypothetical protein
MRYAPDARFAWQTGLHPRRGEEALGKGLAEIDADPHPRSALEAGGGAAATPDILAALAAHLTDDQWHVKIM